MSVTLSTFVPQFETMAMTQIEILISEVLSFYLAIFYNFAL